MDLAPNAFKHRIAWRRKQIGLWSTLASPIVAEALGYAGYDWILIDTEHSPNEVPGVLAQLQALQAGTATPIVRPAWNDAVLVKRLLDIGAHSLLFPFVQTVQEAEAAVASTRYPPDGVRGVSLSQRANNYGRIKDYHAKIADEICVLVQLETTSALSQAAAIAAVDGVDGVFIGPADLSADMGHLGSLGHPEVKAAIFAALDEITKAGKPAGILTTNEDDARAYLDAGFTFVAVGTDLGLITKGADALCARFKSGHSI